MGQFVFAAHSGFRYAVLLAGVVTLILAALALSGGADSPAGQRAVRFFRVFVTFLDVQFLLGILTAILRPFVPQYMGHIVIMLLAVTVGHVIAVRLKKAPAEKRTPATVVAGVLIVLVLIVGGILSIGRPIV